MHRQPRILCNQGLGAFHGLSCHIKAKKKKSVACAKDRQTTEHSIQQQRPCARPGRTHCTNSAELWWPPESCRLPSTVVWMYLPPAPPRSHSALTGTRHRRDFR